MKHIKNNDKGAVVIVEAAFVFPIMFIVLIFLIYMGNLYFQKAEIVAIVEEQAIRGAAYCGDPMAQTIKENGNKVPSLKELKTAPYRYLPLFGDMSDVEKTISKDVKEKINRCTGTFFTNMSPKIANKSEIAKYNNHVIYSTFSVSVECKIKFPISYLGENTPELVRICAYSEVPVDDTTEFIRNTDMVVDYFYGTNIGKKVSDVFGKVNEFLTNIGDLGNK